jgi:hypothetical protein
MQSTAADVIAATNSLNTAIANANNSIANYAEAKGIIDAADTYDEVGKAIYTANETIVAIKAAYDERSLSSVSAEQKSAAAAALTAACKAQTQPTDGCDMSACIVNPGIDGNVEGWTCEKNGEGYLGGPLKPSNDAMEFWGASTLDANAAGKSFDYYQTIIGLPTGAYTISAEMLNSTNGEDGANWNGGGTSGLYGKTAGAEVRALVTLNDESFHPYTTDEIFVVDGKLKIGVKNIAPLTGRWFAVDNFKLTYVRQLTDEEKSEKVNITDAGWATYCSPYALDFSDDITNLTNVYIVTGANGGYLTLTSVKGGTIPANTGLLLEGTKDTEVTVNIPVAASGLTDVFANKLEGVTTATEIAAEAGYVLMAEPEVAFYQNKNAFTVGANTAYLPANFAEGQAPAAFQFITEVTGISEVNAEAASGEIYNLAGQRVSKLQKGLYILNGKKILVK